MIASLNQYSEHPLSRSQFCKSEKGYFAEAKDFESITGKGVGTVNGKKSLGNAKLMNKIIRKLG
jgi:cation transport ATPase